MARAFRALLEDLNARDLSVVRGPHVAAITMVRAGILRSAIGTVMACLDPEDRRGNRASAGQILTMLKDEHLAAFYPAVGAARDAASATLQRAKDDYKALIDGDLFGRGRRLRNEAVAHLLIPERPTPTVDTKRFTNFMTPPSCWSLLSTGSPTAGSQTSLARRPC
jgi:hypothetical protein